MTCDDSHRSATAMLHDQAARCVHELFQQQARQRPAAVALSCAGVKVSYAELDQRADRLAQRLIAAGVGPDQIVAVYAVRSIELIVALLAILKAGGAYLALDPQAPRARLHTILADAVPRLLLTTEHGHSRLDNRYPMLNLDGDEPPLPSEQPRPRVVSDNLAYVSYTSGSTGTPKGVAVPHAAVTRLVHQPDWIAVHPDDVFLQLSPIAFDASTFEIWAPLTNGSRLAVFPTEGVVPERLAELLRAEQVTTLWLTAGLFHLMIDRQLDAFAGLRHVLAGGDRLSWVHVDRLLTTYPGLTFTNGYGPTENTTFTTCWTTTGPLVDGVVPIGRPINGTRVAILNDQLDPVGVEEPGELCTGGVGLARGYLNQPAETAAHFLPDPLTDESGARMYRTGDRVQWQANGLIDFLGRIDTQVKIQGYRVEPGEVEAMLMRHPFVRAAVVVVQTELSGNRRLLAYVVPDPSAPDDIVELSHALHQHLQGQLPAYMLPWATVPLTELPLTANGKVDRKALPAASRAPRHSSAAYIPPRTRLEAQLAELWSRLLAVEPIGMDDDFFEFGGHSLLAAELIRETERALAMEIPGTVLYLQPTIAELAAAIEALQRNTTS